MQKKYVIPLILAVIILLVLVGSIAYKQFNKSPFTDNEQVETLAPKPTEEIKVKTGGDTTTKSVDVEPNEPQKEILSGENGKSYIIDENTKLEDINDPVIKHDIELKESLAEEAKQLQEQADKQIQENLEKGETIPDNISDETLTEEDYNEIVDGLKAYTDEQARQIWEEALSGE